MIRTFHQAREDFFMIGYFIGLKPNRMQNRAVINRVRVDMNAKIEDLLKCIK